MMKIGLIFFTFILCLTSSAEDVYFCTPNQIGKVNINTCEVTMLCNNCKYLDIAITPSGILYGIAGGLYKINFNTGHQDFICYFNNIAPNNLEAIDDSTLIAEYGGKIYKIHLNTCSTTQLGIIGGQSNGDITFYDDDIIVYAQGLAYLIDFDTMNPINIKTKTIESFERSCLGLVNYKFGEEISTLLCFEGNSIYKICHLNGHSEMLCPNVIGNDQFYGAAYKRIPIQVPKPTICQYQVDSIKKVNDSIEWVNKHINFIKIHFSNSMLFAHGSLNFKNASYALYDVLGQNLEYNAQINNVSNLTIDLNQYANGIYYFKFVNDGTQYLKKILLEH